MYFLKICLKKDLLLFEILRSLGIITNLAKVPNFDAGRKHKVAMKNNSL